MKSIIEGKNNKKYTIKKELGRGGFGIVYLVEDSNGDNFALKFIPQGSNDSQTQYEAEIKTTLELNSPNIIKIFDYGQCELNATSGFFIISEYCKDGNYKSIISQPNVSIERKISDIKQILTGLEILHSKTIHRDLKPENILLFGDTLKITDFGLSKYIDEATRTLTFKGCGTPAYMAPEIWESKHATKTADLYSLGIILFESLTGELPFYSEDIYEIRKKHLYSPSPRAKSINKEIPEYIDGIIKKLLLKEPEKRFQSSQEVLEEISKKDYQPTINFDPLIERARKFHDTEEAQKIKLKSIESKMEEELNKNIYKENEVIEMVDNVVNEFNRNIVEIKINSSRRGCEEENKNASRDAVCYIFGNRTMTVHFFGKNELFNDPIVPGRMDELKNSHVVHGGFIEIKENNQDRQGWNLYLTRKPEEMYGQWFIVETDVSALTGKAFKFPPVATDARLFSDNLSCHLGKCMHVYNLKSKKLEQNDIVKILKYFIP